MRHCRCSNPIDRTGLEKPETISASRRSAGRCNRPDLTSMPRRIAHARAAGKPMTPLGSPQDRLIALLTQPAKPALKVGAILAKQIRGAGNAAIFLGDCSLHEIE